MRSTVLLLALAIGLRALAQDVPSAKEVSARKYLAKGKPYKALAICDRELGPTEGDKRLHVVRATAYNAIAEPAKAERDARLALQAYPGSIEALYELGVAESALGRTDSALVHLRYVLEKAPTTEAHLQLAAVHQTRGDCPAAMREVDEALRTGPVRDPSRTLRLIGECKAMLGDSAGARAAFDSALVLHPRDPVLWNSRGFHRYAHFGEHRRAILDYDRAIKFNPNYSYAFNNRGWSKYKLGDADGAIKDIGLAGRKRGDNPYVYRNLGIIRVERGDIEGGCRDLRMALELRYTELHGPEVQELVDRHCGAFPAPPPAPAVAPVPTPRPTNAPGEAPVKRNNAP
ncbi:MAG: tetratricopeptide repeat protein [Flavobacteriales bacterium]|nr:tetratricopeptide repeat protein [Flavobacteriales bacterium]